jgi:hypothetical protein
MPSPVRRFGGSSRGGRRSRAIRPTGGRARSDRASSRCSGSRYPLALGALAPVVADALNVLDYAVENPVLGHGTSLNVAVAGCLVLYRLAGLL